jgi:hypothetical protein
MQSRQAVAPAEGENVPAPHLVHSANDRLPLTPEYVPSRQRLQLVEPGEEANAPASHGKQSNSDEAVLLVEYLPAPQPTHRHEDEPSVLLNEDAKDPLGQVHE